LISGEDGISYYFYLPGKMHRIVREVQGIHTHQYFVVDRALQRPVIL